MHDCSGKEMYLEHCRETWLNPDMVCLIYDITNKESFGHCKYWLEKVKDMFSSDKKMIGCLIGNKIDLDNRRMITQASAKQLADSMNLKYFECSAVSSNLIFCHFFIFQFQLNLFSLTNIFKRKTITT